MERGHKYYFRSNLLLFFLLLLKVIYLLQVVATEVFPVVVGGTIGMDGQTGFLFVQ